MTNTFQRIVNGLTASAVTALLCSCTTSSVKNTWKSPDAGKPAGKIAVITLDQRALLRQGFENRLVAELKRAGASASATYDQFTLDNLKQDKKAAADRFRADGLNSVLILRLLDVDTYQREIQPGGERYAATINGLETWGWYDYYTVGFMSMSPSYGSTKQRVYLETSLFDLGTERRVWSGVTETVLKESTDRLAEMDPLVRRIVESMKTDGVIP